MSQEEIYTKDEHYQDWKRENLDWLKSEFLDISKRELQDYDEREDEFEAYCQQQFEDRE